MSGFEMHRRLHTLERSVGDECRTLRIGDRALRLEGLDAALCTDLDARWGPFVVAAASGERSRTLRLLHAGDQCWLERGPSGERYRIEAFYDTAHRVVASYRFCLGRDGASDAWRVGLTDDPGEKRGRVVENAVRFLAAEWVAERGGFALHSAGVLRDGRAWIFAGPSRSGKTTAVALAAPAQSLGDDFGIVLPVGELWCTFALPFDSAETVTVDPPRGSFPIAAVWRLRHAEATRVVPASGPLATAALMGCLAFPWAMPERSQELLDRVERLVGAGRFAEFEFTRDADVWSRLV
jgi:hypothetical protein